ncbi:DNA-binding protein [Streptomyces minutiscleroticus]|uniref:DNA-binding protein n=1 Tax=Streptomyces minutiscleroticus TaxID=68238 RepID=A0A918KJM2_9ACTN|nr:PAS domain-containing protein [Streptomyces minutiscleroticus]GGX66372.1 DNA-binding protein [Streptomyces minutiscleroticus]
MQDTSGIDLGEVPVARVTDDEEQGRRDVSDASGPAGADEHLIREAEKIAVALGRMFPGLCEVVLHDLRDPQHAVRAIENNLSGRQVGDPATELGLARIADPHYPSVLQNYPNRFPDGRPAKSTSIGIKNAAGEYIAALCLNLDVSVLSPVTLALSNLVATDTGHREQPLETLRNRNARELRRTVEARSAERGGTPRSLNREAKKALVRQLHQEGYFDSRDAAQTIADLLGVSRATVYNYTK